MGLNVLLKVLFIWALLDLTPATIIVVQRLSDNSVQERNSSSVFLSCDYEDPDDKTSKILQPHEFDDILDMAGGREAIFNVYMIPDSKQDKTDYDDCAVCSFHSIKCSDNVETFGEFLCFRRSVYKGIRKVGVCVKHVVKLTGALKKLTTKRPIDENMTSAEGEGSLDNHADGEYFHDIHIPIGKSHRRPIQRRSTGNCGLPSAMSTADATCRSYPSSVKCIQRCAFGYTLEGGIQQKLECSYKDGVWKPVRFQECKPFVDCNLSLTSGGSLDCSTTNVFQGPDCRVSCLRYEDKEAVGEQTYSCNIQGKWDPPLPFCVSPGSGLVLTTAPQKKLHGDVKK